MKLLFAALTLCLAAIIAAQDTDCLAGEVIIKDSCGKCPAGQEYDSYDQTCYECSPGTFKAEEGQSFCMQCEPNAFSTKGASECTTCLDGQVLLKRGQCGTCPPGKYYDSYNTRCTNCYINSFQPYENVRTSCFSCSGDTNSLKGATMCTKCDADQALMKDGTCSSCPAGSYFNKYRSRCMLCPRNTFQPEEGVRDSCFSCSGDTNSKKGATMCTKCSQDEVLMNDGTCSECPKGTFYDSYKLRCKKCGFNQFSKGKGVDQYCASCPPLFYANRGATECFECPDGQGLIANEKGNKGKCGTCKNGFYYDSYSVACYDCGEGYASLGGISTNCIYCENGTEPNADRSACV